MRDHVPSDESGGGEAVWHIGPRVLSPTAFGRPAHIGTYALPTGTYSTGWYEAVKRRFIIPDDDGPVRVRNDASKGKSPSDSSAKFGLGQPLEVRERCVARGRLFKVGTARGINAPASDASRNRLSSCC